MAKKTSLFLFLTTIIASSCILRPSGEIEYNNSKINALSSGTYKNGIGETVVDRFYIANLYTDGEQEGLGQALIYGIACYGENVSPKALKSTPSTFPKSENHTVWKDKPLNERKYVHEFVSFPNYKKLEPTDEFERKKQKKENAKLMRQKGGCLIVHGSDKPQHHKVFSREDYDKLEERIFGTISGTAGTCMSSGLTILATVGIAVGGAAAVLPALVPTALTSSGVMGLFGAGLYCKPTLRNFSERLEEFKHDAPAALLEEAWLDVGNLTEKSLKQKGSWELFESYFKEKNLIESAKIYNPVFVENFNKNFSGKLEKNGGWFNSVQTLSADDFFQYLNSLESEIGEETAKALNL